MVSELLSDFPLLDKYFKWLTGFCQPLQSLVPLCFGGLTEIPISANICEPYSESEEGDAMSENAKRAIVWLIFAVGLILGILGWTSFAYSVIIGTIIFVCFLVVVIALRILWGLGRRR